MSTPLEPESGGKRSISISRRNLLSLGSLSLAMVAGCAGNDSGQTTPTTTTSLGSTTTTTTPSTTTGSETDVSLQDQVSNGSKISIANIRTENQVFYEVHRGEQTFAKGKIRQSQRNFSIELNRPIAQSGEVWISLFPLGGGKAIAKDKAQVTIHTEENRREGIPVTKVESNPELGFHYPYFLHVPETRGEWDDQVPLLVQPNNSPKTTDDFSLHEEYARKTIKAGTSRIISEELGIPQLVPVFPRPSTQPVDGRHFIHALDRKTMHISEGPLERVDLQLLRMIDHAQNKLASESYPVQDKVVLNGFSAAGHFVDRFAVLHSNRVLSVTAGGINGMTLLPRKKAKGHTLKYQVGIADVKEITGKGVDLKALNEVNQFFYIGEKDQKDPIGHDGPWTNDEVEHIALQVYGEDIHQERFPFCHQTYEEVGIPAAFRIYPDAGHTPEPAMDDIIEFHRRSIKSEDVIEMGEDLS